MRIGHLEFVCTDTAATGRFFKDVLAFETVVEQPGGFVWLRSGDAEVLLRPGPPGEAGGAYGTTGPAVVFYVEDLTAAREQLARAGVVEVGEDGGCPLYRTPDGHWFQVVDPRDHQ